MIKGLMNKLNKNDLLKSGFWYTFTTIALQGITFLAVKIYVTLLSPAEYGVASLYQAYIPIFTAILSMGLASSVGRAKFDFEDDYDNYLSSILFLATIIFLAVFTIVVVLKRFIGDLIGLSPNLIVLLGIHGFFQFMIEFSYNRFTIEHKRKSYILINVTTTILIIVLSVVMILLFKEQKYLGKIYATLLISIVYGTALYILFMKSGRKFIVKKYWKYALAYSLPMLFHILSTNILANFDKSQIRIFLGEESTGIYSFAYKIGMIAYIIYAAINKAWVPWLFRKMKEREYDQIEKYSKYYTMLFSLIIASFIFISPEIVKVMGSKEYLGALDVVPVVMASYYFLFLYSFPANIEFYFKKTKWIALGTLLSGVVNIVLNMIFIPRYGMIAAAWTTMVSHICLFVYHYLISLHITKVRVFNIRYFIFGAVFVYALGGIYYFIRDYWMLRYLLVTVGAITVYFKFKKYIVEFRAKN
jgi:O-antigen/teichoic acid export membrane protein